MAKIKTNSYYFPHPADLRNSLEMKRVMKDYPDCVGYGVTVFLLEHLRCQPNYRYPLKDLDLVAEECKTNIEILQAIIEKHKNVFMITDVQGEQIISSPWLDKWMIPYDQQVENNKKAGKKSAENRKLKKQKQLKELKQMQQQAKIGDFANVHEIPDINC